MFLKAPAPEAAMEGAVPAPAEVELVGRGRQKTAPGAVATEGAD